MPVKFNILTLKSFLITKLCAFSIQNREKCMSKKVPVKVRPENLLHSNNIGVKAQAPSNIADHDCNVINRRPKACDTSVISGDICENNISIGNVTYY